MYNVIPINKNSYSQIQQLYLLSFGVSDSLEGINKKYDTSIFGMNTIGMMAVSESKEAAAYYGVFPMVLHYKDKDYIVAQSGDTMTAPNHRKKGLFILLAKEVYAAAAQQKVAFVFGFPNENSFPGFQQKLSWNFYGCMQRFVLKGSMLPLCEAAYKWASLATLYRSFVKLRLRAYQLEPAEKNIQSFSYSETEGYIKKDKAFFDYKLRDPDTYLIQVNGFSLLIKVKNHLYIGTVGYFEASRIQDFLNCLLKLSRKLACKKILLSLSANHWLFKRLQPVITPEESLPIGFYAIENFFEWENISFCQADYDTF